MLFFFGRGIETVAGGVAVAVAVDDDTAVGQFSGAVVLVAAELGQGGEEQAELAHGGESAVVMIGVDLGELDRVDDDLVGGDFAHQVEAEELVVAQVAGDGGVGAAHDLGDLAEGESLRAELVGLEDSGPAGGVGIVGMGHGYRSFVLSLIRDYMFWSRGCGLSYVAWVAFGGLTQALCQRERELGSGLAGRGGGHFVDDVVG